MFPGHTHTHTLTHTQNQASPQTCESSLTSINVKECRGYFAPLSIELLKSLSSEGHRTLDFHPIIPCCCFFYTVQVIISFSTINTCVVRENLLLPEVSLYPRSEIIFILLDALDRTVITMANSLCSAFPSPWAPFWFSAGQISQIKTQSRGIWGALIQDCHMYAHLL